jgi:hypothetical protein
MSVTVILNAYKRPYALREQYDAIMAQSYPDINVMIWGNHDDSSAGKFPQDILDKCTTSLCNKNLGVWARFAFALNATTPYICVLDDDTIPGKRWVEYCLETLKSTDSLIGGRGVKMTGEDYANYPGCQYENVGRGNNELKRVDIVGHSWFFKKEWLRDYWLYMPSVTLLCGGEDMHFSFVLQMKGIFSYIPPQPLDNPELWASLDPTKYGEDVVATSRTAAGHIQANAYWRFMLSNGYTLAKDAQ